MKCTNHECGEEFSVPSYECPRCGEIHDNLISGSTGLLYSICKCGEKLPCSTLVGRSKLRAFCPMCKVDIAAANANQFFIQLIGGTSSGKTTYLAAFQHLYIEKFMEARKSGVVRGIAVHPKHKFIELESMYQAGAETESTSSPDPYSFVHSFIKEDDYQFDIFDIPGEHITSGNYNRLYGTFHGLVLLVDPLSVEEVREQVRLTGENATHYSTFSLDEVVNKFIEDFDAQRGKRTQGQSDIPVAVVITKTDLKVVKREVGLPKINAEFNKNREHYRNEVSNARYAICKNYLESQLGLYNVVNYITGTFRNVQFFPASAIGPAIRESTAYEPYGVLEPITWIANKTGTRISKVLK